MAYRDDIDALNADHHWVFDNAYTDRIGTATGTNVGLVSAAAIAEDATNSVTTNGRSDRVTIADIATINSVALDRRAMSGWVMFNEIQDPPCAVWHEGNASNISVLLGWGNQILFQCADGSNFVNQIFGDRPLADGRVYHVAWKFSGSGFDNSFRAWLDGVELTEAEPADQQIGQATMPSHPVLEFGDVAAGAGGMRVGVNTILLVSALSNRFQHWASWSGADAQALTTEIIREELFEKGALPDVTIAAGTEAAMQTALDALADTVRPDAPLAIRVETVTGDGDLTLTADNITFDPLASIQIQYMGAGTLTWVNDNGGDATIGSTPGGGAIEFRNPVTVTITCLDVNDLSPIENARVLLEEFPGGLDIIQGLTNASGVVTASYQVPGSSQAVVGRARKGVLADPYKTADISATVTDLGLDLTVLMVPDK